MAASSAVLVTRRLSVGSRLACLLPPRSFAPSLASAGGPRLSAPLASDSVDLSLKEPSGRSREGTGCRLLLGPGVFFPLLLSLLLLPEPSLQTWPVTANSLHVLEVPEEGKHAVRGGPRPSGGESSGQPVTTAVFPPVGSPWSLAKAESPHCLQKVWLALPI